MKKGKAANRWRRAIVEQGSSGQDVSVFCRERGIVSSSFYAWRKRLGLNEGVVDGRRRSAVNGTGGFQRIDPGAISDGGSGTSVAAPAVGNGCVILTPNGYRVEAGCCDAPGLRQILAVLRTL
jgi:hypothetical protein